MKSRWFARAAYAAITLFLAAAAAVGGLLGCGARVGSLSTQDARRVAHTNASPNTLTGVDDIGTAAVTAAGPVSQSELERRDPDTGQTIELLRSRAGGTASHRAFIPVPGTGSRSIFVDTASNTRARVGEMYDPVTGNIVMRDVELETNASDPVRAANEGLIAWGETARAQYAASVEAIRLEMAAIEATAPTVAGMLRDALRAAGVPLP